jgi:hypothetical protein
MNSIEQFWGNNKPQQVEPERSKVVVHENLEFLNTPFDIIAITSQQVKVEIWNALVNKGEPLDVAAENLEDRIQDDDSEVINIIKRYHKNGYTICTNDGTMDEFMLDNIDRIKDWHVASVHIGKESYIFPQSPIMKEIMFDTDFGGYELEAIADDLTDSFEDLKLQAFINQFLNT